MRERFGFAIVSAIVLGPLVYFGNSAAAPATTLASSYDLSIPSIGLVVPIIEVGTTAENAIDVPANSAAGHWIGSANPGNPGTVFIDGHVDGVFAKLGAVAIGQTIGIHQNETTYHYRIVSKEVTPLATTDMRQVLGGARSTSESLSIMTCAGTYVPSQGTYDHRLTVYAVRDN